MREYLGLFDALNEKGSDCNLSLEETTYKTSKTIFGFNFSSDSSNGGGMEGHSNPMKSGTLKLQMKFREALTSLINILVYFEFDNIIEINSFGEVTSNINYV